MDGDLLGDEQATSLAADRTNKVTQQRMSSICCFNARRFCFSFHSPLFVCWLTGSTLQEIGPVGRRRRAFLARSFESDGDMAAKKLFVFDAISSPLGKVFCRVPCSPRDAGTC